MTKKKKKPELSKKSVAPKVPVQEDDNDDLLEEVIEVGAVVAGIASLFGDDDAASDIGSDDSDFSFGGGDTNGAGSSEDW
jgi:uncharacterized membrane protein YgcG